MFLAQTLGLQGDSLYYDAQKFLKLSRTPVLTYLKEPDLRNVLDLVKIIMNHATLSISESEAGPTTKGTAQKIDSKPVSEIMQRYASSIGQQMAIQDATNESDDKITWKILELHPEIQLKSKAILTLVAFATMYGKIRLVYLVRGSNKLANSITLLKQQEDIQAKNDSNKWFVALGKVMKATLDLADRIMDLKDIQPSSDYSKDAMRTQILLSTSVYRIVYIVVICWSQAVTILNKHDRKNLPLYLGTLSDWERELNNKRVEIERTSAKDVAPQEHTKGPDDQTQANKGALPLDKEAVQKEAMSDLP
ncbi:hypothetical protein BUALT_Bualt03G0206200 [Buddleja alternifolia]|uniref:Sieve element occlusion N-terminal domain-containing protein n=1 Tax=Buddleja alternifolia TaxID=168488 RepID=A0AAV6Y3I3_9LAMI|nr:hypothetical protein BUALT_Bualt03G0206200 [Buddleja alternifolia]